MGSMGETVLCRVEERQEIAWCKVQAAWGRLHSSKGVAVALAPSLIQNQGWGQGWSCCHYWCLAGARATICSVLQAGARAIVG